MTPTEQAIWVALITINGLWALISVAAFMIGRVYEEKRQFDDKVKAALGQAGLRTTDGLGGSHEYTIIRSTPPTDR
jgi:hypothetical protein